MIYKGLVYLSALRQIGGCSYPLKSTLVFRDRADPIFDCLVPYDGAGMRATLIKEKYKMICISGKEAGVCKV